MGNSLYKFSGSGTGLVEPPSTLNWGQFGSSWTPPNYQPGSGLNLQAPSQLYDSPDVPQLDTAGAVLPKNILDGTDIFGANSMPGAWGNWGSVGTAASNTSSWMPDWLKGAVGTKEVPGWGGMAMGAASGIANMYMGMKQYGLAKDTLAQNKQQFQMQYDAQKKLTNASLEDRQRARINSTDKPGTYESVSDYMKKYGV